MTARIVTTTHKVQPRTVPFTMLHLHSGTDPNHYDTVLLYQTGNISYITGVLSLEMTPRQLGRAIALCLYMHGRVETHVKDDDMNTVRKHVRTDYTVKGKAPTNA